MNTIEILDDVVSQLTDNFTKAKSVNYLYKKCKKTVENKLNEMEGYNFNHLLNWLEEIKSNCCKGKYKTIKRIIYAYNSLINNNEINSKTTFVYYNNISQLKKISEDSKSLICEYIKNKKLDQKYSSYLKNILGYYFVFIESNNLEHKNISYKELFNFKNHINSLNLSKTSKHKILNVCAKFLYETGKSLQTKIGSAILEPINNSYIEKITRIDNSILKQFDLNYVNIDFNNIDSFFEELSKRKYSLKSQTHFKRISCNLLFFSFYYKIPLNLANTLLWSKFVYENISKDLQYRSASIKFVEFLQKGSFSNLNTYFNSSSDSPYKAKHKIDNVPSWSKSMIDKYISYRKSLGYKYNTIVMDCNSIYRFIIFISNLGINDYSLIKSEHLISFAVEDNHSTAEGRNAYLVRVKNFIIFLNDNGVLNLYVDSKILGSFRAKKKLVDIISQDDIFKIISRKYTKPFEIRSYAIFLLGIKCGLRSIDVVNLKFKNISFKNKILKIKQIKTQKEIELPIPTIVLNAIYDYVKNARPKSSSEYVFISFHIPFSNLNRSCCGKAFEILKNINGIDDSKYKGFHICRKTYASFIINKTKDIDITAYSLGHSDNSTVDDYISLDTLNMRECPLSLNEITYGGF